MLYLTGMSDTVRRFIGIMAAILCAYFLLHVLRSLSIASEARGVCAGIAGYMVGDIIVSSRRRRKR
jgi:hypothetical protein